MNISFIPMALMQMLIWTHCLNYSYQIMVSINANCVTARPPLLITSPRAAPRSFWCEQASRFISNVLAIYISIALNPLRFNGCQIYKVFFFNFVCLGKDLSIQYIIGESYTLSFSPRKDYNYWLKNLEFLTEIYIYRISAKTY